MSVRGILQLQLQLQQRVNVALSCSEQQLSNRECVEPLIVVLFIILTTVMLSL